MICSSCSCELRLGVCGLGALQLAPGGEPVRQSALVQSN